MFSASCGFLNICLLAVLIRQAPYDTTYAVEAAERNHVLPKLFVE